MKKHLIVGLGNPGAQYEHSRHNVGFVIVESLPVSSKWTEQQKGLWEEVALEDNPKAIAIKPLTFMNKSGSAVASAAKKHGVRPENILIIHDELDIELGEVKMTFGKSAGTHKGVESVIKSLKTKKFWRVRVGIAPSKRSSRDIKDFLLTKMTSAQERKTLGNKKKILEGILLWLEHKEKGMQRVNTP